MLNSIQIILSCLQWTLHRVPTPRPWLSTWETQPRAPMAITQVKGLLEKSIIIQRKALLTIQYRPSASSCTMCIGYKMTCHTYCFTDFIQNPSDTAASQGPRGCVRRLESALPGAPAGGPRARWCPAHSALSLMPTWKGIQARSLFQVASWCITLRVGGS